ncbi:MAG: type II secretion system F family protein [Sedimentisphaerales bacterium]|nr:type II secretion system F family protein [Sedimentisphaerales bacterium]
MSSPYALIYHDLAVLLDAGVPTLRSLNIISEGLKGRLKIIFSNLSESVSKGNTFADSMAKHPKAFARLDITLVKSAELSGELPNCFKMLSKWYEFKQRIKGILISGFMLPFMILHIMVFIVPMPALVLGKTSISEYLIDIAITLGSLYLFIGISLAPYHSMPDKGIFRRLLDTLSLRIPILGLAIRELSICRYCRGFSMLYKAGLPIAQCATQATELTGNLIIADIFKGASVSIEAGNSAYEGFSRRLPLDYLNLWQTGEEIGELDKMSDKIAEISGDKAELLFTEFAKWLPRLLYALICLVMIIQIFKQYGAMRSSYNIP